MFFFKSNLKKPLHAGSAHRRVSVILLCLFTVFLFVSCNADPGGVGSFVLEGKWASTSGDSYTITRTSVSYFMPSITYEEVTYPETRLIGNIEESVSFSDNAGVLIIQVTETEGTGNTVGNFTGVYYRNGTENFIEMGNAINADYSPVETITLSDAKSTFTAGNAGKHISMWGKYTR